MRSGNQKHATTVYHVIWAELLEDTLAIPFVGKKARTVCQGSIMREHEGRNGRRVEDLLNVVYKDAIPTLCIWE